MILKTDESPGFQFFQDFITRRILNVTWHEAEAEAARKTAGQNVLEATIKKGWPLCWSCAMHGRLQKSKTGEEQNTGFLMRTEIEVNHALHGKVQSGEILTWWTRRCLSQGDGEERVEKYFLICLSLNRLGCYAIAVWRWPTEKSASFGSVFVRKLWILVRFCLTIFSIV